MPYCTAPVNPVQMLLFTLCCPVDIALVTRSFTTCALILEQLSHLKMQGKPHVLQTARVTDEKWNAGLFSGLLSHWNSFFVQFFPQQFETSAQSHTFWKVKMCWIEWNATQHAFLMRYQGFQLTQTRWNKSSVCSCIHSVHALLCYFYETLPEGNSSLVVANQVLLVQAAPVKLFHWCRKATFNCVQAASSTYKLSQ